MSPSDLDARLSRELTYVIQEEAMMQNKSRHSQSVRRVKAPLFRRSKIQTVYDGAAADVFKAGLPASATVTHDESDGFAGWRVDVDYGPFLRRLWSWFAG